MREVHVLQSAFGNLCVRGDDVFENLGVCAAHVFDESDLAAEGELEYAARCDQFLVDDSVDTHALCQFYILEVFHFSDCPLNSEALGSDAGEDICLRAVCYRNECVIFPDRLFKEHVRVSSVPVHYCDVVRKLLRQFKAFFLVLLY